MKFGGITQEGIVPYSIYVYVTVIEVVHFRRPAESYIGLATNFKKTFQKTYNTFPTHQQKKQHRSIKTCMETD